MTRNNVAAAIVFWPAVIGNYSNAQQALEAASKRNEVLVALANQKCCKFSSSALPDRPALTGNTNAVRRTGGAPQYTKWAVSPHPPSCSTALHPLNRA